MINKVYEKTKDYIKENYKGLLIILIIILCITVKLPYYISAPGGLINTKEKVDIETNFKMKGSLNMAYVTEVQGTIPLLIYGFLNPNWDIEKEEEVTVGSESIEDEMYRNKMLLEEANDLAILVAYNHSDVKYKIENNKVYVTYVDDLAKTDLKVQDQIIEVDNKKVTKKQDLYDAVKNKKPNDKINFKVIRNKKEINCNTTLIDVNGEAKVGLILTETFKIKSDEHVDLKFKESESGSSGGLMLTLPSIVI